MDKQTDGPAFPTSHSPDYPHEINGGLTLRDYFAAKALQGLLADTDVGGSAAAIAKAAYAAADAMLAERSKP